MKLTDMAKTAIGWPLSYILLWIGYMACIWMYGEDSAWLYHIFNQAMIGSMDVQDWYGGSKPWETVSDGLNSNVDNHTLAEELAQDMEIAEEIAQLDSMTPDEQADPFELVKGLLDMTTEEYERFVEEP